jgi:Protein of unknown function (DUF3037)
MPVPNSFNYATVRVVPRVDRDEFVNAGVIVYSSEQNFLGARIEVNEARLRALWPSLDVGMVERHLQAICRICAGDPAAGPIARLSKKERFYWLTAPRSAVIQISPVRTGLSSDPASLLDRLARELVATA